MRLNLNSLLAKQQNDNPSQGAQTWGNSSLATEGSTKEYMHGNTKTKGPV